MPCMQRQNPHKSKFGHHLDKIPPVLSEVQARNLSKCRASRNNHYQRASRLDAEPITHDKPWLSALSFAEIRIKNITG